MLVLNEGILQDKIGAYLFTREKFAAAKTKYEDAKQAKREADTEWSNAKNELKRELFNQVKNNKPQHILIKARDGVLAQIDFTKGTVVSDTEMEIKLYPKISTILSSGVKDS